MTQPTPYFGRTAHSSDEWETPDELFGVLDAEFGFELDVCATSDNAKCDRFFSRSDDGLCQQWSGVCWMNPPFGREIGRWVEKARRSAEDGATVVALLPVRSDTGWWHDNVIAAGAEIRFLRGRVRYRMSGRTPSTSAPFPCAVVIWRSPTALREAS